MKENTDYNCLTGSKIQENCEISIVMPVYQSEAYLRESVESLLIQEGVSFEILCIDDGSTDNSLSVLMELAKADNRISVFTQPHKGVGYARNLGMYKAVGKYIYFMDSDDILKTDSLRVMHEEAERHKLDILNFDAEVFFDANCTDNERSFKHRYERKHAYPSCSSGQDMFAYLCENGEFSVTVWMHLYNKEFLQSNNILFYGGIVHNDNIFNYQAYIMANRVGYTNKVLYLRRIRPGSIMNSNNYFFSSYSYFIVGCKIIQIYNNFKNSLSKSACRWSEERIWSAFRNSKKDYSKCDSHPIMDNSEWEDMTLYKYMIIDNDIATDKKRVLSKCEHNNVIIKLFRIIRKLAKHNAK